MKGVPWCANLHTVTVPRRDTAKWLTVIYPYYENPLFLSQQVEGWKALPTDILARTSFIVVDDGSPKHPASNVLAGATDGLSLRLFRIGVDIRWNWLAARNIGFHKAQEGWCLVTDMDHVIPEQTFRSVLYGEHDPSVVYAFARQEHTGQAVTPHSASFLMTRRMFWHVGGYDETLSGFYGTDGDYRRRLAKCAPIHLLTDKLIRHEYQGDSSTSKYLRKQPEDAAVKKLVAKRGKGWRPKVLSFPYEEVALEAVCQ